ncbi:hypothetical protein [Microbacterium sp. NPDC089695]|uniref:hypothetical protein n=1 Tax=Microbacterium sp. NPDC089695 TaxID=3364198 RepID=UPI00381C9802
MTPSFQLARFLAVFLVRRVLRRGVLRSRGIRWFLLALALGAFLGFCAFGVVTLGQLIEDPAHLRPLLRVVGTSTPLWVLTLFTVVRVLFLRSSDLVELTFSFPLTNRARTLGFLLFEAMIVGIGVTMTLGALIAGTVSIGGVGVIGDILACLVMPAAVAYLLASIYHLAIERLLMRARLARLRAFLVPVILAATLAAVSVGVSSQAEPVLFAAVGQGPPTFAPQLVFADIAATLGPIVATAAWLTVMVVLVCAVCATAPRQFDPSRRFVILPRLLGGSEFSGYLAAHLRAIETITVCGIAVAGSYALLLADVRLPPVLLLAVGVQSVYAYVATEPIRASGPRRHAPAVRYLLMLGPQIVTLALVAVPVCAMSALTGARCDEILAVLGFAVSNIVVLTLAGIAFPPEKGNPFSVIAGIAIAGLAVGTITLGSNLLGLPAPFTAGLMLALTLLAVVLSITGMDRIERTARHEVVV